MPRVYFSYAPEDDEFARWYANELVRAGVLVESRATLGEVAPERIDASIRDSDAVVYLRTQGAEQSSRVQREIAFARSLSRPIFEVTLRQEAFPGLADSGVRSVLDPPPDDVARAIRDLPETDRAPASEERARGITFPASDQDEQAATETGEYGAAQPAPAEPPAPVPPSAPPYLAEPPAPAPITGAPAPKAAPHAEAATITFSAYHANTLPVETWNTLLVYSAVSNALNAVAADAATFTELGSAPRTSSSQSTRAVAEGAELTVEPHVEGVTFSPPSDTFIWRGGWHRSLFRFQAASALSQSERAGWVDIYAGPMVPIARIDLTFSFIASRPAFAMPRPAGRTVTSNVHDTVFISYSHRDREAFRQACEEYARFGITIYTDDHLEAGADYDRELGRMIAAARVFHLLWSPTSAHSSECRKEWTAALRREPTERFIKPWFWKQPLTTPPPEFTQHHISFRFQRLRRQFLKPETWF